MGDGKRPGFARLILIAIVCFLAILISAYNKTAEEKRRARAEEALCPSILRDIETARTTREEIPPENAAMAEKCKQLGYR
jgi:hypothetical protein